MEKIGRVIGISGKLAEVEIEPKGICGHRASRTFWNPAANKIIMEAINEKEARVGDMVKVETKPKITILVSFLIFILPIISFGIGFSIIDLLTNIQNLAILGGIGFMIAWLLFLKLFNDRTSKTRKFRPVIKEILKIESKIGG